MPDKMRTSPDIDNLKAKTVLMEAEKALSRALGRELRQTSEHKNAFAEFVHEIRTPLNAIMGYLDMLHHEINGPLGHPDYNEYIDIVYKSSQHLQQLCDQLLTEDMEKMELTIEEIDVSVTIDGVKNLFLPIAEKRNITLKGSVSEGFPTLHTDPVRLNQILINLVSNSIKYTQPGGTVEIMARYHENSGAMIFVIQDNGQGMSTEDTKHVFDAYKVSETPSPHGDPSTGLGLNIVNRLIKDMYGELALCSYKDEGTLVRLAFPISAVDPKGENITVEQLLEQKHRVKTAIIDDNIKYPFAKRTRAKRKGRKR